MLQYVEEALRVLFANRVRSALTALGLIIGVMAVIAIQVLGSGMAGAVGGVLTSVSDRSFTLVPNTRQSDFARAQIKPDDILRAKHDVPGIVEAIPAGGLARLVRSGHHQARLAIAGDSDDRFITTPLRYGRAFTAQDVAGSSGAHRDPLRRRVHASLRRRRVRPDRNEPTHRRPPLRDRRRARKTAHRHHPEPRASRRPSSRTRRTAIRTFCAARPSSPRAS